MDKTINHCSFCYKSEDAVAFLIVSPDNRARICDECVAVCNQILEEQKVNKQ